jgi:hypothetical protein
VLVWFLPALALGVLLFGLGAANGLTNGPSFAVRITRIPAAVRAQALTAASAATMLGATAGLAAAGPAFEAFGFTSVFVVLAGLQLVSTAQYFVGARRLRTPAAEIPVSEPLSR